MDIRIRTTAVVQIADPGKMFHGVLGIVKNVSENIITIYLTSKDSEWEIFEIEGSKCFYIGMSVLSPAQEESFFQCNEPILIEDQTSPVCLNCKLRL